MDRARKEVIPFFRAFLTVSVMEVYAGAAVMGLFAGAVVGQATGRVVSKTLDLAVAGAGRAYENIMVKDPSDPEARNVFRALEALDVSSRLRMTNALVQSLEKQYGFSAADPVPSDDPVRLCVHEVKVALDSIEECLDAIRFELDAHQERYLHRWRVSGVAKHLQTLKIRLDVLDKRLDMLAKCRAVRASTLAEQSSLIVPTNSNSQLYAVAVGSAAGT